MTQKGVRVVKVGGALVKSRTRVAELATVLGDDGRSCVLVHGGGTEVTDLQHALGFETEWHQGLRVTGDAALDATIMVLCGTVNRRIVTALNLAGVAPVGLSGIDAATIRARPLANGGLGHVGEPETVRTALLRRLLDAGYLPVLAPVSAGPAGPLNVNADLAAAAVAAALGAEELLLLTDVPGVLTGSEIAQVADLSDIDDWIGDGTASAGMIPKLRAAGVAARAGVSVRIGPLGMLWDPVAGTRVEAAGVVAA